MPVIDLNSDLGESYGAWAMGDDKAMLEIVSSANIACGFHAGDPSGLLATLRIAAEKGVVVGAHISYPDRVGFGRRAMQVESADLTADAIYQIGALQGLAKAAGTRVSYVKPHGALYNTIAFDPIQGQAIIDALLAVDRKLVLMTLAGAPLVAQAKEAGLSVVSEAFADRAYTAEGRLLGRGDPRAVLSDPARIAERMVRLARTGEIETVDGNVIGLEAGSICVHGDSPDAVAIARTVRDALASEGVTIGAFAG